MFLFSTLALDDLMEGFEEVEESLPVDQDDIEQFDDQNEVRCFSRQA